MIAELRREIGEAVRRAAEEALDVRIDAPKVEDPPRPDLGDLAVPVALELGRRLDRNPREVAEELRAWLDEHPVEGVAGWEVAGPGFLNVDLARGRLLSGLLEESGARREGEAGERKILVEHTSINPNKAAHIGHLRNACLGDSLVRVLRHRGHRVEVHNYIDDTGVQVADVVMGLIDLRGLDADAVRELEDPFDYACWDLYTEVTARLETDPGLRTRRQEVLVALERDEPPEAEVASVVVDRIVRRHLETMGRLGIEYDLLVKEGDIVAGELWSEAFELLRESDSVFYVEEGKHAGCWVMRLSDVEGFEELEEADKVLVRSNGTATYVAKDIAYHFWKYGLLERDLRYRPFVERDGHRVWESTRDHGEARPFGGADRAITVIDVRQSYLQSIVELAFRAIGEDEAADRLTHFAYEMVALTPRTAEALGILLDDEDRGRAYVEMSGRRGHGVKADDLLDALEERAAEEVREREPDIAEGECATRARQIAVGAARYFLLRFSRNTVIAFDLEDSLAFEGETGPYLQYSAVRADSIFEKVVDRWGIDEGELVARLRGRSSGGEGAGEAPAGEGEFPILELDELDELLVDDEEDRLWKLVLVLARFDEAVAQAAAAQELSGLAKYAFEVAQQFNKFYHRHPILQEEDPALRGARILVARAFRARLREALELLGIPLPDRM